MTKKELIKLMERFNDDCIVVVKIPPNQYHDEKTINKVSHRLGRLNEDDYYDFMIKLELAT